MVKRIRSVQHAFCFILIFLISVGLPLCAQDAQEVQDDAEPAVLRVGPLKGRGLLFLPVNVIDYYSGEYTIGEDRFSVYYTEVPVAPFDNWQEYECDLRDLLIVDVDETDELLFLLQEETWHVFFQAPIGSEVTCTFIDEFIKRLRYFKEVTEPGVPPFPAILDIR